MKENNEDTNKNMTLQEAKEQVYKLVQQGTNYRDIAKKEFLIEDRIKRFSISEISKIVKEFTPNDNTQNKDPDVAFLFTLFRKGYSPVDAVIKTGFKTEFVAEAYNQFLEFEDKVSVPEWFIDKLDKLSDRIIYKETRNLQDVVSCFEQAVLSYEQLRKFTYPCNACDKSMQLGDEDWKSAKSHLIKEGWGHGECAERKRKEQERLTTLYLRAR